MTLLSRRALTLGLAALPITALAAPAGLSAPDKALVDRAVAYLQGLREAKARFTQTDARGRTSRGSLYLKRPGKARFVYEAPSSLLVVSDGALVSIHNPRLGTFESYPLVTTPLALFLAREIRLDRGVTITEVSRAADGFAITARDGKKQTAGAITLYFADRPLALRGWTITDPQGETHIRLSGLTAVSGLDPALFVLKDPRMKNPGRARM